MKKFVEIIIFTISFFLLPSAFAQGWKPLCVNDTDNAGKNNGTWQKLNTSSSGGNTWKKVGDCIPPVPPINGGRPYSHILDTGASMWHSNCNALAGFAGDGDTFYTKSYYKHGALTPNRMDGFAVYEIHDMCGQGLVISFDDRVGVFKQRQHFKSITFYNAPINITYVWGADMEWRLGGCDQGDRDAIPPVFPTECSYFVAFRGRGLRMQPYSRYYINVIY